MTGLRRKSRPDIVLVISDLGSGGAQRVASSLVETWVQQGRHVHVVTMHPADTDYFKLPAGVERTTIRQRTKPKGRLSAHYSNLNAAFRIRRLLREQHPDAVLSFLTATNVLVLVATLGLGLRVVVSERNDPQRQDQGPLWGPLRHLTYRFASAVTANSDHAVEVMSTYVPRARLAMVPNPVILPERTARPRAAHMLLTVGRLVPQKAQSEIIDAFARIVERTSGWQLKILGEGPERDALTAQVRKHALSTRVFLPGFAVDPAPFYREAGVFVLASRYEGTPNTLLEAMAHGLPCIVPDCLPGALAHVEDGVSGFVYRAGEGGHLADCLARLMHDPALRERLGAEARRRMKVLAFERVAAQWDTVLFPDRKNVAKELEAAGV